MIKPIRIQRSRKEKQVSPNGLEIKYVGRPTKFGNPFKLVGDIIYVDASYRRKLLDPWVHLCIGDINTCVKLFESVATGRIQSGVNGLQIKDIDDLRHWAAHFSNLDLSELKGKNLSCWCGDTPCHADVLLKIAEKT